MSITRVSKVLKTKVLTEDGRAWSSKSAKEWGTSDASPWSDTPWISATRDGDQESLMARRCSNAIRRTSGDVHTRGVKLANHLSDSRVVGKGVISALDSLQLALDDLGRALAEAES